MAKAGSDHWQFTANSAPQGDRSFLRPPRLLSDTGARITCSSIALSSHSLEQPNTVSTFGRSQSGPSLGIPVAGRRQDDGDKFYSKRLVDQAKINHGTKCRPSPAAHRENVKAAKLSSCLAAEMQNHAVKRPSWFNNLASPAEPARRASGLVAINELRDDLSEVGHMIEAFRGGKRFDRVADAEEADADEKRERERERREEMKRDFKSRDPRRKVELRIEYQRQTEQESPDLNSVPMTALSVLGVRGSEQVNLVDVRAIRARCKHLGKVGAIDCLLEDQRERDKEHLIEAALAANRRESDPFVEEPSTSIFDRSLRERCMKVRSQKRANHVDTMLKKIRSMRSSIPDDVVARFELESLQIDQADDSPRRASFAPLDATRTSRAKSVLLMTRGRARGTLAARRISMLQPLEWRARARRRWRLIKSTVMFLILWFWRKRRDWAIFVVKDVLDQFGEWLRVRHVMAEMTRNIIKLQRAGRKFVALKKHRCEMLTQDWERIEDAHLFAFFKLYTHIIMEEWDQNSEHSRRRHGPNVMPNASKPQQKIFDVIHNEVTSPNSDHRRRASVMVEATVDWRKFRIPHVERKRFIDRFYMAQLQRHVQSEVQTTKIFQSVLSAQKDMVNFLKQFGADVSNVKIDMESGGSLLQPRKQKAAFWQASEATVLSLIALAALDLRKVLPIPFKEHPSTKDIEGNTMFRGDEKSLEKLRHGIFFEKLDVMELLENEEGEREASDVHFNSRVAKPVLDMDDVFDNFTFAFEP